MSFGLELHTDVYAWGSFFISLLTNIVNKGEIHVQLYS